MPKISVITPCHNTQAYIGKTIESVCSQSLTDWEHIVVDDGSTDGSQEVIESCLTKEPRLRMIDQPHRGGPRARNAGFMAISAGSRYLLFLDADDCIEPRMLEVMTNCLDRHPEVGLAYCGYRFVDQEDRPLDVNVSHDRYVPKGLWVDRLPPESPETPFASVFVPCDIITSVAVLRRSVYEQTPGWDENFGPTREETDLFFYMALRSKVHYVPQTLVRRRRHPAQITGDPNKKNLYERQRRELYEKWRRGDGLTAEEKARVREARRFREGRVEPFLAFRKAKRHFKKREFPRALQFYLGGARRYLLSFFPWA